MPRSAPAAALLPPRRAPDPGVLPRSDPSGPYLWRPLTHTACPPPPHTHAHMLITAPTPGRAAVPGPTPAGRRAPLLADPGREPRVRSVRPRLGGPWTAAPYFGPRGRTALPHRASQDEGSRQGRRPSPWSLRGRGEARRWGCAVSTRRPEEPPPARAPV